AAPTGSLARVRILGNHFNGTTDATRGIYIDNTGNFSLSNFLISGNSFKESVASGFVAIELFNCGTAGQSFTIGDNLIGPTANALLYVLSGTTSTAAAFLPFVSGRTQIGTGGGFTGPRM